MTEPTRCPVCAAPMADMQTCKECANRERESRCYIAGVDKNLAAIACAVIALVFLMLANVRGC